MQHLELMFSILKKFKVSMSFFKCHFAYFLIILLEHHVSKLEMFTTKDKIKIIKKLVFSQMIQQLKNNFNFCNYYKFFVFHYASIMKSLKSFKNDWVTINISKKLNTQELHFQVKIMREELVWKNVSIDWQREKDLREI